MSEHRCAGGFWSRHAREVVPCGGAARFEEGRQHWCAIHLPSAERARQEKRDARRREKSEAKLRERNAEHARNAAVHAACAGVDDPQPGELAALRAEVARMKERV